MAEDKTVPELMREFVAELMLYLRQRGREAVTHVVVEPLQQAGIKVALLLVATALAIIGLVFLGNFMVLYFAWLCGGLLWGYLVSAALVMILAAALVLVMSLVGKEERTDGKAEGAAGDDGHGAGSAG